MGCISHQRTRPVSRPHHVLIIFMPDFSVVAGVVSVTALTYSLLVFKLAVCCCVKHILLLDMNYPGHSN